MANRPFCQCTLPAATIITETTSAGPAGPRSPRATSRPPANSLAPAAAANGRPGRKPSCSKNPAVPARQLDAASLAATKGDLVPAFLRAIEMPDPAAVHHELDVICVAAAADRALAEGRNVDVEYA